MLSEGRIGQLTRTYAKQIHDGGAKNPPDDSALIAFVLCEALWQAARESARIAARESALAVVERFVGNLKDHRLGCGCMDLQWEHVESFERQIRAELEAGDG
jgi:hypothetical protein